MAKVRESLGGVVRFVTAVGAATRKPILLIPEFWIACTCTGMSKPEEATAPTTGATSVTWSACTFARKIKIVSSEKLPAPSVARPTIMMLPPAPELDGNVTVRLMVMLLTVLVNVVSWLQGAGGQLM